MRFTRQEHFIITSCDQEITNCETITQVLQNLLQECIEFSLSYNKWFQSDYRNRIISYNRAKIKEVHEDNVDLFVLEQGVTIVKGIKFTDIISINVISTIRDILKMKEEINRFDLMDIEQDEKNNSER